jgi:carbonic anhydrase
LDESFRTCSIGLEQSPINILNEWPVRNAIELDYKRSTFQVIDNGHTVQVNVERGSFATIAGQRYELKHINFHAPSEHLVENRPYQMEVHFVHGNERGQLAVIGAFINPGKIHEGYQTIWDYMPVKSQQPIKPYHVTLDLRSLLPTSLTAFHYAGSLTTPPCTENVSWNILHATLKLSQEQIDRFKLKYPMNARPAQPLNYRKP